MRQPQFSLLNIVTVFIILPLTWVCGADRIERKTVVGRHTVQVNRFHELDSLSVGNGGFAFTVDPTGLQSFPEHYENGVCLGTMAEWGWHRFPNTQNYQREETLKDYPAGDRLVPIAIQGLSTERQREAANYFRQNPHRLHLGIFGFQFESSEGQQLGVETIQSIDQVLDPWTGEIHSHFEINNQPVTVVTLCDPDSDTIAFKVISPLLASGQLHLRLRFPYPTGNHTDSGASFAEIHDSLHLSKNVSNKPTRQRWIHTVDETEYIVELRTNQKVSSKQQADHDFLISFDNDTNASQPSTELQGTLTFLKSTKAAETLGTNQSPPNFGQIRKRNQSAWKHFWNAGAIVDFKGSTDPRANELERRIILSRYLTRIQCAGKLPPQETGLTFNSWYGKFHLEMHWWHAVHWALWGQPELLEQSLPYYSRILGVAAQKAQAQGYDGVRWPKMTDPRGEDSPSDVGEFLIWQQPHFIYYAETLYRLKPQSDVLDKYAELVFQTADFMADLPIWSEDEKACHLGPPLIPAQERLPKLETVDPAFELRYWKWALHTAQLWKKRLGSAPDPSYQKVLDSLPATLADKDDLYLAAASALDSYSNAHYMSDHPMVLGAIGMLPIDDSVELSKAKATYEFIEKNWNWPSTWGWDYPMMAMAATRLGNPDAAVESLLMDMQKNTYLANGHNYQDSRLRIYLPGNGALLTAVAMMCAGFDGCETATPGFPKEGWEVRWEGLNPIF